MARAAETFRSAGVADRVTRVGQSFFDPLPPGADLYLLDSALNDWPNEETIAILRRCAEACRPTSRVVVIGGLSADEAPRRLAIESLLVGGKTNSLTEFREIAHQASLDVASARQHRHSFVVKCHPRTGQAAPAPHTCSDTGQWQA